MRITVSSVQRVDGLCSIMFDILYNFSRKIVVHWTVVSEDGFRENAQGKYDSLWHI